MKRSRQKDILFAVIENTPTIAFFAVLRVTDDLRLAGWVATLCAGLVGYGYLTKRLQAHTILLGINIYMLVITPLVEALLLADANWIVEALITHAQTSVLIAVFVTGSVLTVVSKNGFVGVTCEGRKAVLRYSGVLLGLSMMAVVWSLVIDADRFVKIGLPLVALFGTRRFLVARILGRRVRDKGGPLLGVAGAGAIAQEPDLFV